MCTNGSGTNSVNPPVRFCRSRVAIRWRAQWQGLFDRAEHDRHVRREADGVGDFVGVQPFLGGDLVRAQDGADAVVEDLRGGSWKRPQPDLDQAAKVLVQRFAETFGAFGDFERGETVDVDPGRGSGHCPADVDVVVAVEVGMDAALQCHLGGTTGLGLGGAGGDVIEA